MASERAGIGHDPKAAARRLDLVQIIRIFTRPIVQALTAATSAGWRMSQMPLTPHA